MNKPADEVFREYSAFNNAFPLPVGDPSSPPHAPKKSEIRDWANGLRAEAIDRIAAAEALLTSSKALYGDLASIQSAVAEAGGAADLIRALTAQNIAEIARLRDDFYWLASRAREIESRMKPKVFRAPSFAWAGDRKEPLFGVKLAQGQYLVTAQFDVRFTGSLANPDTTAKTWLMIERAGVAKPEVADMPARTNEQRAIVGHGCGYAAKTFEVYDQSETVIVSFGFGVDSGSATTSFISSNAVIEIKPIERGVPV